MAKATATAAPKKAAPVTTVTLRQMAAELAEQHELPKRQAEALLNDLITLATKHLKKGDRVPLPRVWECFRCGSVRPAWAGTRPPGRRLRSRPVRRLLSGLLKN